MIRITIQPDLLADWKPILERQLNLKLASLRDELASLRVRFATAEEANGQEVIYRCEIRGRTVRGKVYRASARHTDGRTAISDVLARTCRAIARERQRREVMRGVY